MKMTKSRAITITRGVAAGVAKAAEQCRGKRKIEEANLASLQKARLLLKSEKKKQENDMNQFKCLVAISHLDGMIAKREQCAEALNFLVKKSK